MIELHLDDQLEVGSYQMCYACRMPLKKTDLKDDKYEKGVSCHYCYDKTSEQRKERFLSRQKQIEIAKSRGTEHFDHKSKNNLPILYSFRRCPYAMRARMAIHISGQKCELREVLLRDKPPSMLEYSPKGTVPVLILQDGNVIDESLDVIDWALNLNDPMIGKDLKMKKTKELMKINDGNSNITLIGINIQKDMTMKILNFIEKSV